MIIKLGWNLVSIKTDKKWTKSKNEHEYSDKYQNKHLQNVMLLYNKKNELVINTNFPFIWKGKEVRNVDFDNENRIFFCCSVYMFICNVCRYAITEEHVVLLSSSYYNKW